MYAIISTGGKQYKVEEGMNLRVEKLTGDIGADVAFDDVLFIGTGSQPKIGSPVVSGAKVTAKIVAQDRAKKVLVYKKKRRKGYEKRAGHRQPYTEVKITKINI